MKTILKKIALMFPAVRQVKADLNNRRRLAEEYEAANTILLEQNDDLIEQLGAMKSQMTKMMALKTSAIQAEAGLAAKAEHFHGQVAIVTAKYEQSKRECETLDAEICHLRLENHDLIRTNAALASKSSGKRNVQRKTTKARKSKSTSTRKSPREVA